MKNKFPALLMVSGLLLLVSACPADLVNPSTYPHFAYNSAITYGYGDGQYYGFGPGQGLGLFDYSGETASTAVTPADFTDPQAVLDTDGPLVFAFDQLLDPLTIETPIPRQITVDGNPQDDLAGEGDYQDRFVVIDTTAGVNGYTPKNDILVYVDSTDASPGNPVPQDAFNVSYYPTSPWATQYDAFVYDARPPTIVVTFKNPLPADSIIVIHFIAGKVTGYTGIPIPAAKNANGDPITFTNPNTNETSEVAATVVFKTPA